MNHSVQSFQFSYCAIFLYTINIVIQSQDQGAHGMSHQFTKYTTEDHTMSQKLFQRFNVKNVVPNYFHSFFLCPTNEFIAVSAPIIFNISSKALVGKKLLCTRVWCVGV